jgi:hypothetical protein
MVKEGTIDNIYDLIDLMKPRPAMYIGDYKISAMNSFLDGYQFCSHVHNIKQENVFPPFWYFHEWAKETYNWYESTAGWKNIILQENDNDEAKALTVFFDLMADFKTLHPIKIERLSLEKQNLDFLHSDECSTKYMDGQPLYETADAVLLVTYSHNFGLSYFVSGTGDAANFSWRDRFKTEKAAKESIERLFGKPQNAWEVLDGDLLTIIKQAMM